ncbi:FAD-dependent oxidoreductase [Ascidiimonas aurantiaca]|uniref:NAD(P)/FAD-dependent oxidoreductase n=1 Tax=Ascidiimonas aurantiaca TaxID=1685432 RepID=UPI0030EC1CC6
MTDYIVVGSGLAGIAFCETLQQEGKSFIVYEDSSQHSSTVAGGLYNPIILKRFTKVWKAREQLDVALPFYRQLEEKLEASFDYKVPVRRRFVSVQEQNKWFEAADKPGQGEFMSLTVVKNQNPCIDAPYGFGEVLQTGRVASGKLQAAYREHLREQGLLREETFQIDHMETGANEIQYKDIRARYIVFADGFGMTSNPWFLYLPLNGTKGQLLTIKAPTLQLDFVLKSAVFLIPLGHDFYKVGATYEWHDKTNTITSQARNELLAKMETFITCPYEVTAQEAGIRPTVTDRRPLVGRHPQQTRILLLNGMGSRGVMVAPYIARQLYDYIEKGKALCTEINIKRFEKKHFKV